MSVSIICGDCLEVMPTLVAESIDAVVCDPPYGLGFMDKAWDHGVPGVPFWTEALRVAKPGAHLLAFGGTRTFHRLTVAIEDAGWEIRDCLSWLYGSGFPKSLDVSKAIDKAAGAEREVVGLDESKLRPNRVDRGLVNAAGGSGYHADNGATITAPATDAARQWDGYGTALKPAWEPIILARKPLIGTVAANVQEYGTGAINIDACRIDTGGESLARPFGHGGIATAQLNGIPRGTVTGALTSGRWPANVVLDEESARLLDEATGQLTSGGGDKRGGCEFFMGGDKRTAPTSHEVNSGGASRFFYTAKASRSEREQGLEGMVRIVRAITEGHGRGEINTSKANHHPTVKPIALMRWLCRLVTPPNGLILDPFTGSGSTGCAAVLEGFRFIGIEREAEYIEIATKRIAHHSEQQVLELEGKP